jgi:hypothetical protein
MQGQNDGVSSSAPKGLSPKGPSRKVHDAKRQRGCTRVHVLRGGNGCAGRWAMNHGPDVRGRANNGMQHLTTNLSADSVSDGNGESEDDEGKNESNQDFHSEISLSVYGA